MAHNQIKSNDNMVYDMRGIEQKLIKYRLDALQGGGA